MLRKFAIAAVLLGIAFGIPTASAQQPSDEIFKARVLEVLDEQQVTGEAGDTIMLQKLRLKGLEGAWEDKEVIFDGTEHQVVSANHYQAGDTVIAAATTDTEGNTVFYVTDFVRSHSLYWLAAIFAVIVVLVGRLKGLRALVVLTLTFVVILGFVLPQLLEGRNPLFISIIGAIFILLLAIFITEGVNRKSVVAVASITLSLIITGLLAIWFTNLARLTGFASEDAFYLKNLLGDAINLEGLLLAGIIIGSLGVLDDVVIAQVETVAQLRQANPALPKARLFRQALTVGISHMSAMVNTLFLAYAGAALPLLLLFSSGAGASVSFSQALNNELIATEIVRTLTGSIGLVLAVPLATAISLYYGIGRPNAARSVRTAPANRLKEMLEK